MDVDRTEMIRVNRQINIQLERAATQALQASGRFIPWQVVTISTDGRILEP